MILSADSSLKMIYKKIQEAKRKWNRELKEQQD